MGRDDRRPPEGGRNPHQTIGGSQVPGGIIQRDNLGRLPDPIVLVKSHNPIAGPQPVIGSPKGDSLAQLAYYQTPDNVPRRVTVFVTQNGPILSGGIAANQVALYVKITIGSDRGSVAQWVAAPCAFPCEGQFVKVEANIGSTPPNVLSDARQAINGAKVGVPSTVGNLYTTSATAIVVDGWTDDGPSIILANSIPCGLAAQSTPGYYVSGPVIVDSISLTNTNATGQVLMAICDTGPPHTGAIQSIFQMVTTYVPALTTVSIGKDLLGTFGNGVNIVGIIAPPSLVNGEDVNDANVYATIRGRYLLPGGT